MSNNVTNADNQQGSLGFKFKIADLKFYNPSETTRQAPIFRGKIHNPSVKVDPDFWRMYIPIDFCQEFVKQISSWHPKKIKILRDRVKI